LAVCAVLGLAALPASAQVIDVGADGSATTYAGPVISSSDGVRPIAPPRAPTSVQAAAPGTTQVLDGIRAASARHGVSAQLVEAVAWQESHLHQDRVSPKGARGVMQLMPDTARVLGVDAADARDNIEGGTAYLAKLLRLYDGDVIKTLAAYNAGPLAVQRYGGAPPYAETQAYVAAILDRLAKSASAQGDFSEAR
jgi:soluble lytic murein transglycosylase-like protein